MKAETAAFLTKADEFACRAEQLLAAGFIDDAGRTAYMAGFHAAQALIFETGDRVAHTHSGVQTEFARIVRDALRDDSELRGFLGRAYTLKSIADYETDDHLRLSAEQVIAAITVARRFVLFVRSQITATAQG